MLSHLVIRNFAIIGKLEIPFHRGLTVLSGETGAGKSIVIDALNLLLAGRATTDVIRTDEDHAVVEGIFELGDDGGRVAGLLDELGIESGESQLLIRRIVSRSGRNKVFVNGCLTTLTTLAAVTRGLVDISGQHEHISLMNTDRHLEVLDEYAVLGDLRAIMRERFDKVRSLRTELAKLRDNVRERINRIDFLRYQLQEIDTAQLKIGEDDELERELHVLKYAEKIVDNTLRAESFLYGGESSASSRLGETVAALTKVIGYDESLQPLIDQLNEVICVVDDVAHSLTIYNENVESNPRRLDTIQARLETLKVLRRKFGVDVASILQEADTMRAELHRLENAEERGSEIEAELRKAEESAFVTAKKLSSERRQAALLLSRSVQKELAELNMANARLDVSFEPAVIPTTVEAATLSERGLDAIEFLLAANAGEAPKPIQRVASGGELSRIMLAIKGVLAERDSISTYVFDEVDTGIGGSTADMVGAKIAETAADHQVICITHLAQIASRGQHHYLVEKVEKDGKTEAIIRPLSAEERIEEIARMLGGARVTSKTRDAAEELLQN
jgi:DNA repair protein RecN (Recombination protein N)